MHRGGNLTTSRERAKTAILKSPLSEFGRLFISSGMR